MALTKDVPCCCKSLGSNIMCECCQHRSGHRLGSLQMPSCTIACAVKLTARHSGSVKLVLLLFAILIMSFVHAAATLTAQYNNLDSVREVFAANKHEIAGIILEPVVGNSGYIEPTKEFLQVTTLQLALGKSVIAANWFNCQMALQCCQPRVVGCKQTCLPWPACLPPDTLLCCSCIMCLV